MAVTAVGKVVYGHTSSGEGQTSDEAAGAVRRLLEKGGWESNPSLP